jgi:cell wall-associated NlpC family hydrolase
MSIFRAGNIDLPRDRYPQKVYTQPVAPTLQEIDELQPRDLVVFSNNRSDATHVGIYIGNYQFIHFSTRGAYRGVKISTLKDGDNYDKYLQAIYFRGGRVPKRTN